MLKKTLFAAALLSALYLGCKGPAGPPGDAESLSDPSVQPKVIYTYPPANSLGPYPDLGYSNQIQIRFNKFMDPTSVRRAVKLSSPTTSIRNDTNSLGSVGGDLFYAYARDSSGYYFGGWKTYETYTLSIASSAKDINGNSLLPAFSMTFAPEPYFRIRSVSPSNGATDVLATATITLNFNSPVDASISSLVQLSPWTAGQWNYGYDSTWISYEPFLTPNTKYTITVGTSAHDKLGHQLPQMFSSTFTTASFRVLSTYPADKNTDIPLYAPIEVNFTGFIDTGFVRSAFTIIPTTSGNFATSSPPIDDILFVPQNGLLGNTTYTVTLGTTIRSSSGDRLSGPYTFSFTTAPFEVTDAGAGNWTGVTRYPDVLVNLNGPIDTGSVRTAFSMKDSTGANVDGTFGMADGAISFHYYPINLPLPANATYTVTISTALRSMSGTHLASPYTFSFTTAE